VLYLEDAMITAQDLEFHTPPDAGHTWAETYFFPIILPQEGLMITVYVVVRPGLGVMSNDVTVYGALSQTRADLVYYHAEPHLPAPQRFSDIHSSMGLSVKAVRPPRDYRIDYVGFDNTEIHVDWIGLMEPFDIHDPTHSPRAGRTKAEQHANSGLGAAWGGHFDMTGRVQGTVKIRGRSYTVDCVERMDHSWGHRNPVKMNAQDSISASFGPDLAMHVIAHLDLDAAVGQEQRLAHAYILEDGQVYGIRDGALRTTRLGNAVTAMDLQMVDVRGKTFDMHAYSEVGAPWNAYVSTVTYTSMMRWFCGNRVGHGCVMETMGLSGLSARYGRRWTQHSGTFFTG
jgi:hypothetical protein